MITHPKICPHCKEANEPWLVANHNEPLSNLIWDCCGATEEITPAHYLLKFGKYEGSTIDDVNDEWYLNFLEGIAKDREDWILAKCLLLKKQK